MKKVMTFGTFDVFHPGHLYYLREAKKLGNYLVTVVARDETVLNIKWKRAKNDEKARRKIILESFIADAVVLGSLDSPFEVISEYRPDVLCFGYDQRSFNDERLKDFLSKNNLHPEIIVLPAFEPEKWKSSKL